MASGLLVLCFGEATKFSARAARGGQDAIVREVTLGVRTSTGDAEGEVMERGRSTVTRDQVELRCEASAAKSMQIPPDALRAQARRRPLYVYARAGHSPSSAAPRKVTIQRARALAFTASKLDAVRHLQQGNLYPDARGGYRGGAGMRCAPFRACADRGGRIPAWRRRIRLDGSRDGCGGAASGTAAGRCLCSDLPAGQPAGAGEARFLPRTSHRTARDPCAAGTVRVYGAGEAVPGVVCRRADGKLRPSRLIVCRPAHAGTAP